MTNPKYEAFLHAFNDNVSQFLSNSKQPGGGNAIIRPWAGTKAFGIPTGYLGQGGFGSLESNLGSLFATVERPTYNAKELIDMSFERALKMIEIRDKEYLVGHAMEPFTGVFYSTDPASRYKIDPIGTSIFADTIGRDVVDYITNILFFSSVESMRKGRVKNVQNMYPHQMTAKAANVFPSDAPAGAPRTGELT